MPPSLNAIHLLWASSRCAVGMTTGGTKLFCTHHPYGDKFRQSIGSAEQRPRQCRYVVDNSRDETRTSL